MDGKITHQLLGDGHFRIDVAFNISEDVHFPMELPGVRLLTIDLGDVTYMNSMGIRNWVRWLNSITSKAPELKIELLRLPLSFVRATEVLTEVIPPRASIKSFGYDVFCEDCDKSSNQLVDNTPGAKLPEVKCPKCGKPMQSELPKESYETLFKRA